MKNWFNNLKRYISAGSFRYSEEGLYVFTGTSAITWQLPGLNPSTNIPKRDGYTFLTHNRGTAILTQGSADSRNFYAGGQFTSNPVYPGDFVFSIPAGDTWDIGIIRNPNRDSSGVRSVTGSGSVAFSDGTITADATSGAVVMTLPLAADAFRNGVGCKFTLVKTDSSANAASFARSGSDTINGAATNQSASAQWSVVTVQAVSSSAYAVIAKI